MPDWNNLHDPYNITFDRKQFNRGNVKKITNYERKLYAPFGDNCLNCSCWTDDGSPKPDCFDTDICLLRQKDYTVSGSRHIVTSGKPQSLMILIGTLVWNHERKVEFIFRACIENGIEMHHKNFNPHDNRFKNLAMVEKHSWLHGDLKKIKSMIKGIEKEIQETKYSRNLNLQLKKAKELYHTTSERVEDSPKVFEIIQIINNVRHGVWSIDQGQDELEAIDAAFPREVIENKGLYDFRKLKNQHQHIIDFHRRKGNAI